MVVHPSEVFGKNLQIFARSARQAWIDQPLSKIGKDKILGIVDVISIRESPSRHLFSALFPSPYSDLYSINPPPLSLFRLLSAHREIFVLVSSAMSSVAACCTCATLLSDTKIPYSTDSEKPLTFDRNLECCGRTICASCQYDNPRFQSYCPFCQIAFGPNPLPANGLRLPPAYPTSSENGAHVPDELPPAYSSITGPAVAGSQIPETDDVVHHLTADDSLSSLSLAYQVPTPVLRTHNGVYSDNLLSGRKWILIPRSHYQGPPLSSPPNPEEEERKNRLRRWMVATKCPDYDFAVLYLKGSLY
jgi:LysM repeat protein